MVQQLAVSRIHTGFSHTTEALGGSDFRVIFRREVL